MMRRQNLEKSGWLSKEKFIEMLRIMPIPCIDLIIEFKGEGILFIQRSIPPYKDVWALVGGRILKGETLKQAVKRIAKKEVGLDVEIVRQVGTFTVRFKTEYKRHDVSTCYHVVPLTKTITLNESQIRYRKITYDTPKPIGGMYSKMISKWKELEAQNK